LPLDSEFRHHNNSCDACEQAACLAGLNTDYYR
jgi:hypothetical protein